MCVCMYHASGQENDQEPGNQVQTESLPSFRSEQIKRGSTGSMLQEHFMISGTSESETLTNKNIYE